MAGSIGFNDSARVARFGGNELRLDINILICWSLAAALAVGNAQAEARPASAPMLHLDKAIPVQVRTSDGRFVCNPSAAFSQVPDRPDLFIGRGIRIGSQDDCHKPNPRADGTFLALFRMDWALHTLLMQGQILVPPLTSPEGVRIRSAVDPYVAAFQGELWVAFECTVPAAVGTCLAPLKADLSALDVSRLSVVALGSLGPDGPRGQIVATNSASAPTLFRKENELYLYWQVDYFRNEDPRNHLVTRGMRLVMDNQHKLWGAGSQSRTVPADDDRLTTIVRDVEPSDPRSDHVAVTTYVGLLGDQILEMAAVGGSAGRELCRSTHQDSDGCWRLSLALPKKPLERNGFNKTALRADFPANPLEYARLVNGPDGKYYILGYFATITAGKRVSEHLEILSGLQLVPIEISALSSTTSLSKPKFE